jgi:hypothetical protein
MTGVDDGRQAKVTSLRGAASLDLISAIIRSTRRIIMKGRPDRLIRLALFTGFLALSACITTNSPQPPAGGSPTACGQTDPSCNVLEGYSGNSVPIGFTGATISGGGQRGAPNQVNGNYASVGGGEGNFAGEGSTVAGGSYNSAIHFHATVGGGANNLADSEEATVAGGYKNTANQRFATVGGGAANLASDLNTTVSGGSGNTASYQFAAVGGGTQNLANNSASVVAGGDHNLARGAYSSILGGLNNSAYAYLATIGGGAGNIATGSYSVIPGGFANSAAGNYSFAVGRSAHVTADHPGAFLFADSSNFPFPSVAPNEFAVRATGGVRLITAIDESGASLSGVRLSPGSGAWETLSDYNSKAGFAPLDESQILQQLMSLQITSWYYRGQDATVRHIGPTAQDFRASFNIGRDGHYISTVDADGVALASIQELYRLFQNSRQAAPPPEIASLETRLAYSNALAAASFVLAITALWKRSPFLKTK